MGPRVAAAGILCVLGGAALASADGEQCHFDDSGKGWMRTEIGVDHYKSKVEITRTASNQDTMKELAIPDNITEGDAAIQICADMTVNETDCWEAGKFQLKLPILDVNGTLSEKAECHCFPLKTGWQNNMLERTIGTDLYILEACVECTDFKCQTSRKCIDLAKRCDGFANCGVGSDVDDASDEENCAAATTTTASLLCPAEQSPCANGVCKPTRKFCDGYFDCTDESDEVNCSTSTVTTTTTINATTTNTYEQYGRREALSKLRNKEDDSGLDSGTMTIIIVIAVVVVVVILLFTLVLASGKRKKSRQQRARDMMKRASMASAYNFANPGYGQEPGGGGGGGDDSDDDDDEDDGSSAVAGLSRSSSSKSKSNSGAAAKDFYGGGAGYLEVDGSDDDDDDDDDSDSDEEA